MRNLQRKPIIHSFYLKYVRRWQDSEDKTESRKRTTHKTGRGKVPHAKNIARAINIERGEADR